MAARGKFDALEAVARLKLPAKTAETIVRLVHVARALQRERNKIVHGCWYRTSNPRVAARHIYRSHGSLALSTENVSASRLASHVADVVRLCRHLNYALERRGIYRRGPRP
jgi:hypothetical protein